MPRATKKELIILNSLWAEAENYLKVFIRDCINTSGPVGTEVIEARAAVIKAIDDVMADE